MEIDFTDPNCSNEELVKAESTSKERANLEPKDSEDKLKNILHQLKENRENQEQSNSEAIKSEPKEYIPFEFRATAKEYFKIWIVNIALTVVTLGIYSAWAKVRTNRYLYASTYLNGANFEYNANPKRILIGRLIVVGFYGVFYLFSDILGMYKVAVGIALLFLLLLPWLIRQAIRFRLKSTSYRNIHFSYKGSVWGFYKLALIAIFLFAIYATLSYIDLKYQKGSFSFVLSLLFSFVLIPILYRGYKLLVLNNAYYGKARFNFDATRLKVIGIFISIALITFIFGLVFGAVVLFGSVIIKDIFVGATSGNLSQIATSVIVAAIFSLAVGFYKGLADGFLSNFTRDHTELGSGKFKGDIEPISLGFISATNAVAVLLSVGLLFPWAKVRYLKYKFTHTLFACNDYDKFVANELDNISTVGEEAMDFFDIDIGV